MKQIQNCSLHLLEKFWEKDEMIQDWKIIPPSQPIQQELGFWQRSPVFADCGRWLQAMKETGWALWVPKLSLAQL